MIENSIVANLKNHFRSHFHWESFRLFSQLGSLQGAVGLNPCEHLRKKSEKFLLYVGRKILAWDERFYASTSNRDRLIPHHSEQWILTYCFKNDLLFGLKHGFETNEYITFKTRTMNLHKKSIHLKQKFHPKSRKYFSCQFFVSCFVVFISFFLIS